MLGITKLLCGITTPSDDLRYGGDSSRLPTEPLSPKEKRPIVVWNMTRRCNLRCIHCYSESKDEDYIGELTTEEGKGLIEDISYFKVPTILFSGGEPFMRKDLFELASFAIEKGIRGVISTNGTLITPPVAMKIREIGISYVGISLDGLEGTNDRFRGKKGAFEEALRGIRNCSDAGVKVGLRFTLNSYNYKDLPAVLDLLEKEDIPRCCVYHLVYSGRGSKLIKADISHEETRHALDIIFDKTGYFYSKGITKEILTVDNHANGVYLYLKIKKEQPERAEDVLRFLRWNGGASSGIGIGNVDNLGYVHADQFWRHYSFGNVRERRFSEIWMDTSDPIMAGLKNRKGLLKGRCSRCKYLDICNGNFRVRAEAVTGDVWESDPACYLTDEEIGI
ncbi:MAG: radical SAM protein [Nitrospinae bacterium]|nr:radical SAM protein [Nitrospinota bacterium]